MSIKATQALGRLKLEFAGKALGKPPSRDGLLLEMIFRLDERVTFLETEASATQQAGAAEDLEPRPAGDWIALKEAAFRSGKSLAWIHKYRSKGEIAEHSEGGHVLVNVESLERAIVRCGRTPKNLRGSDHDKQT
jgi:hypothetical protein